MQMQTISFYVDWFISYLQKMFATSHDDFVLPDDVANASTSEVSNADGVSGMILYSGTGNKYFFRVTAEDGTFVDYELLHSDLAVTIHDKDAAFYRNADGNNYLDHCPETLGIFH